MKKLILLGSVLISSLGFADIDLSNSFAGNIDWGYSGIETNLNYTNFELTNNDKNKEFLDFKRAEIKTNLIDNLLNSLEKDNKDRSLILGVNYDRFNSTKLKSNNISTTFGFSRNTYSRIGINLHFNEGKYDTLKTKDMGLTLYYNSIISDNTFNIVTYVGKYTDKNKYIKDKYYGIYGEYEHSLANSFLGSFDYLVPSLYFNTHYQRYESSNAEKNKNSHVNDSLTSTIGLTAKNTLEFENSTLTTKLDVGYKREFLSKKIYKTENIKNNREVDSSTIGISVDYKYNELINIYGKYSYEKSLNTSKNGNKVTLGLKVKF